MKKTLPCLNNTRIRMAAILVIVIAGCLFAGTSVRAQIYEPEGLNMPGGWNGWTNPPVNNLALASATQVPGGRIVKFSTGITRWQTIFSVAASGGDIVGGSYPWLFASGGSDPWGNKWANVNVTMNTLQLYTIGGATDNSITLTNGKWYTMNFQDAGYVSTRAIFMETSAQPVDIASVSVPAVVDPGNPVVITVTLSQAPSVEELFYVRYSTDGWVTSGLLAVSMTGTSGTAIIPGLPAGTFVSYYAFSSVISPITADYDLLTLKMNTNGGINYFYAVTNPTPVITFANLQYPPAGTIDLGQAYQVYGRVGIPGITGLPVPAPGLEAWIGYSTSNSDPALWTDWIAASYTLPVSGYDEFSANPGVAITTTGTWYYATRFRYNGGAYLYGGYSSSGGGFWDGTNNVSGVLTVRAPGVPDFRLLENISVGVKENMCYDARQTITVAGNGSFFKVLPRGSVTMIAGRNIIFLPGTTVSDSGILRAYITTTEGYCASPGAPVAKEAEMSGTGLPESGTFSFRIFPNPASADVTVDLQGIAAEVPSWLELSGIRGNRIYTRTITGQGTISLPLSGLPPGVYCIRIISGDRVQTRMLVKQ
jgi:hypothetical protein